MANISNESLPINASASFAPSEPLTILFFPTLILCILGIPGTIVTSCFYGKQSRKSVGATPILLTSLAVYDMLSLVCTTIFIVFALRMIFFDPINGTQDFFCHYYVTNYVNRFPKYCSNFMLMIIAIERFYSVVKPHKVKKFFTKNIGILCIIGVTVIIPVSLLPRALEYECIIVYDSSTDGARFYQLSEMGKNRILFQWLYIGSVVFYFCLPILCIIVCNTGLIAFLLHRRYSKTAVVPLSTTQAREMKTTKLVLVVTCLFVACVSPLGIFYSLRGLTGEPIPESTYLRIMPIATLLEVINYSINTLVYYIGSVRFREEVQQILFRVLCPLKKSKIEPISNITNTTSSGRQSGSKENDTKSNSQT